MKGKFSELIQGDTPVLIDFYADWCGPCKAMAPVLQQLKKELSDQVKVIKIDTEKNRELSMQFNIRGIPTFMLFRNGKAVWQHSGMISLADLKSVVQQAAG